MTQPIFNLDQKAAHYAQQMVRGAKEKTQAKDPIGTLERLVTKTLGVLQEQGVYALVLFLYSRTGDEDKIAPTVRDNLFALLDELPNDKLKPVLATGTQAAEALNYFSKNNGDDKSILDDLNLLLLVRDLYEQTLIYARFGAKAESNTEKDKKDSAGQGAEGASP